MKKNRIATRMGSTISLFTYFYNLNFNLQYNFPLPLLARIILEQESLIKIFAVGHEYMITLEKKVANVDAWQSGNRIYGDVPVGFIRCKKCRVSMHRSHPNYSI